jgi:hypothetical protein
MQNMMFPNMLVDGIHIANFKWWFIFDNLVCIKNKIIMKLKGSMF